MVALVADRGRVRESRRARHSGLDVLEREDLVVVAVRTRAEVERRAVDRIDVVTVVEARRPARDGEALVGCVVEAAGAASQGAVEGRVGRGTYSELPSFRQ
jgi:hypothetical protein